MLTETLIILSPIPFLLTALLMYKSKSFTLKTKMQKIKIRHTDSYKK